VSAFAQVKKKLTPPRVVKVPVDAWEPTWKDRPAVDVAMGLRPLSIAELKDCRVEAKREATGFYEEQPKHGGADAFIEEIGIETYNEVLLCEALARAACNPNNVGEPYFDNATVTIRDALTSESLRWLWSEYTIMQRGARSTMVVASDEELKLLARCLRSDLGRRIITTEGRHLCAYLLSNLQEAMPDTPDEEEIAMDNILLELMDEGVAGSGVESVHVARSG
jgi:hypothetical protein